VIAAAVGLVGAYAVGVLLLRARSTGRLAAVDRAALVRAAVDAVVVLALVRAVAPPPGSWSWVWVVAAGLVGVGVARAALRWPHLPAGRVLPTAAYLVLGALVVAATA
jgi:hypothetical protein